MLKIRKCCINRNWPTAIFNGCESTYTKQNRGLLTSERTVMQTPVVIKNVVLHQNAHLDEYLALYLLQLHGEQSFPGIGKAELGYYTSAMSGDDNLYDSRGILPLGCGRGRFDEHKTGCEDQTATSLVASHLQVDAKPELQRLLQESFLCDKKRGASRTQLAEQIKLWNRVHLGPSKSLILRFVRLALDAIVNQETHHPEQVPGEKSFPSMFTEMEVQDLFDDDPKIRRVLRKFVDESTQNKDKAVTELSHIVECLWRKHNDAEVVGEFVEFALSAMQTEQVEFQEQVTILRKLRPIHITYGDGCECTAPLVIVESESRLAQKAARYLGASIILVRNPKSHNCQIFSSADIDCLNLDNAVSMIRWLELPLDKKYCTPWHSLGVPEEHAHVPHWHYFKKGEMLFNGSESHDAPPTSLTTTALVDVLRHAFCYPLLKKWCSERRIMIRTQTPARPTGWVAGLRY